MMAWVISTDKYHGMLPEAGFPAADRLAYGLDVGLVLLSPAFRPQPRPRPRDGVAWVAREEHDTRYEILDQRIGAGLSGYRRASCRLEGVFLDLHIDNTQALVK